MGVAIDLVSGFVECLLLVAAVDAVARGHRLYVGAVAGLALVLYSRMADGFASATVALTVIGLVLAGVTVVVDLLFEVAEDGPGADPSL